MFIRNSSKFVIRKGSSGFKWFFYGSIFGAVAVFILMQIFYKSPEPIQLVINTPSPSPAENPEEYTWSDSGNLGVVAPKVNASVNSPLTVIGMAKLSENKVYLRLKSLTKDKKGQTKEELLVETTTEARPRAQDFHGPFEASLEFETTTKEGFLEVFGLDKNNKEIDKLTIPLKLGAAPMPIQP